MLKICIIRSPRLKKGPLPQYKILNPKRPFGKHVSSLQNVPRSKIRISIPPFHHSNEKNSFLEKNAIFLRNRLSLKRSRDQQDVDVERYIPNSVTSPPIHRSHEKKAAIAIHEGIFPPFPLDADSLEINSNEEAGCKEDNPPSSLKSNLKPIKKVKFKSFLTRFFTSDND